MVCVNISGRRIWNPRPQRVKCTTSTVLHRYSYCEWSHYANNVKNTPVDANILLEAIYKRSTILRILSTKEGNYYNEGFKKGCSMAVPSISWYDSKPPWGGCYALRGWRPWLYSSGSSYREFVWEAIQCFHRVVYWACKEYQSSQAHSYLLDHTTRCMIQPYIRVHLKMDALTHIIPFGHHRIKVLRSLLQNLQGVQLPIPLLRLPLPLDCLMLHETH